MTNPYLASLNVYCGGDDDACRQELVLPSPLLPPTSTTVGDNSKGMKDLVDLVAQDILQNLIVL